MLELALEQHQMMVGSYRTILDKLNKLRISQGYAPIGLEALRTASFKHALAELNGTVLIGRGPVVIPLTMELLHEWEAALERESEPGGVPTGNTGS
jgi:hypothetical protein